MSVDLHRISTGISSGNSRNGFGKIVSFPVAGGFPAAGTYAGTLYGVEYPIAEGGASVNNPVTSENVATQTCDVNQKHNGSGGVYTDWTTVTNIQYYAFGVLFYTDTTVTLTQTPVEVQSGSGYYYNSEWSYQYYRHDGYGGVEQDEVWQYWANETFIKNGDLGYETTVPSGGENDFLNGKYDTYLWNGVGGYTTLTDQGSYFSAGTQITIIAIYTEVPHSSGVVYLNGKSDRYNWDGSGGYVYAGLVGSYFANGTFITSDDNGSYYFDGTGNYYTE